jgi:transcriptional regulator NrdR family protein
MTEMKVKKKDNSIEDFNREKLVNSLKKAGMKSKENIEKIENKITSFVKEKASKGAVETTKIRGKVLESMRTLNNEAASKFENFSK